LESILVTLQNGEAEHGNYCVDVSGTRVGDGQS